MNSYTLNPIRKWEANTPAGMNTNSHSTLRKAGARYSAYSGDYMDSAFAKRANEGLLNSSAGMKSHVELPSLRTVHNSQVTRFSLTALQLV